MADIDIVPKRHSSTWMWVVLAIVVIGLIWWMTAGGTQNPTTTGSILPATIDLASAALPPTGQ